MTTIFTLPVSSNHKPTHIPTPSGISPVMSDFVFDLAADNAGVALNDDDAIEAIWFPAFHVLVANLLYFASDELDTNASPTLLLNVGTYTGASESAPGTLDEDALVAGFTTGATWQTLVGPSNVAVVGGALEAIGWSRFDRKLIITADQDPATDALVGKIRFSVGYRPRHAGDILSDA